MRPIRVLPAALLTMVFGAMPGCNCGGDDVYFPQGGSGGETVAERCQVVDMQPGFGAVDVNVVNNGFQVSWSEPVDLTTIASALHLLRLDDNTEVPVIPTIVDDRTILVTPLTELRFFSDYGLQVDDSVVALSDGEACSAQSIAFSTIRPAAAPLAPRAAPLTSVAVFGQYAIGASSTMPGLQVLDFSSPSSPELVATVPMTAAPTQVRILDGRAYVAAGTGGVYIFDLSDPSAPKLLGVAGTPGRAYDVAPFVVDGAHYIAVADGPSGIRLVDVENPEGPVDLKTVDFDGNYVTRLALDGTNLLAVENGGFAVVDVSDPTAPATVVVAQAQAVPEVFDAVRPISDAAWVNGKIAVSLGSWGVQLFSYDTENGTATFLDHWVGPNGTCTVSCEDDIQLETSADGTLVGTSASDGVFTLTVDVSDQLVASDLLTVAPVAHAAISAAGRLFVATDGGLWIHQAGAVSGSAPIYAESNGWGQVRGVAFANNALYAASQGRGLLTLDPSTANVDIVDVDATAGIEHDYGGFDFAADGSVGVLADGRGGFAFFDLTDPLHPVRATALDQGFDVVSSVVLSQNIVYGCDGNHAMRIYDVSDLSNPISRAALDINADVAGCVSLALSDDRSTIFVAGEYGLATIDVSDITSPKLTNTLKLPAGEHFGALALAGSTLYASTYNADWEAGLDYAARKLVAFDVSVSNAPTLVFQSEDANVGGRMKVRGTKLFAAAGTRGVLIYDITDPAAPELEGEIETAGDVFGLTFSDSTMYLGARGAGVIPVFVGATAPLAPLPD
ncbi:MAG: Ig-like domain-containing protein [Polyangiaceae bacterium]